MLRATEMIESVYGQRAHYKILSSMAQSFPYAVGQLGHRQAGPTEVLDGYGTIMVNLEKHLSVESFAVLCH